MSFYAFVAEFLATAALYKVFLLFKARFLGIRSRSFLQDTVLFLLPVYAGLNRAAGQPLSAAFDLTGLMLPLYLAIARIGCFLGGCCYGVPWQGGVLYPSSIFQAHEGCRSFRPGADPGRRVFPVQLAEAAGGFAIFAALLRWDIGQPRPRGLVLPAFLLSYCALRFSLDFVRRASARPRIGALSEAQVYSIGVKEATPSATALAAAAVRALESLLPEGERLFEDPFAAAFLQPWHRGLLRACKASRTARDLLERALDRIYPGVPGDFICRTRYIDDHVRQTLESGGIDRFVVLGAGYDTRALRVPSVRRLHVTEVDHPATQARKRAIVERLGGGPARLDWVAHDLRAGPSGMQAALGRRERTFWVIEGVTGYLPRESVRELLAWIAGCSAPGSALVVTYVRRDWVEGTPDEPAARAILRHLERMGEPFVSGWDPATLARECGEIGIRIEEDLSEAECARRYPSLAGRGLTVLNGFRIARGSL
jgi:methyltransferase (TIGR00027 family)